MRGGLSGTGRISAPFRIDGRSGNWVEIERKWAEGELDDEAFEDDFIEYVIIEDIGEGTDGWDSWHLVHRHRPEIFDGAGYIGS
ncbi:hypothetical protein [Streptomyces sp. PSKA30]|uniref:hypothetical protein n=1 Tax=Streptomyces sp. PSKA30 TaxID=2874597 RepID=UPI001CD06502|nr:hypothetical protein [Streptomyces sp. PSKA30]MBZ9644081.1 hypothetical protein [Streptomyces sp. PSKA30]